MLNKTKREYVSKEKAVEIGSQVGKGKASRKAATPCITLETSAIVLSADETRLLLKVAHKAANHNMSDPTGKSYVVDSTNSIGDGLAAIGLLVRHEIPAPDRTKEVREAWQKAGRLAAACQRKELSEQLDVIVRLTDKYYNRVTYGYTLTPLGEQLVAQGVVVKPSAYVQRLGK